jgi:GT2 family glycosyltransferase
MPELEMPKGTATETVQGTSRRRSRGAGGETNRPVHSPAPTKTLPPGEWRSSPEQPEFYKQQHVSAGWVQVKFEIDAQAACLVEIYLDTGSGFNAAEVLRVQTDQPHYRVDLSWCVPKDVRAIRLAPVDSGDSFTIRNFSIRSISRFTFYGRAARRLFRQAASQQRLSRMVRRGLKALATGGIRKLADEIRGRSQELGIDSSYDYNTWIERRQITPEVRKAMIDQPRHWTSRPRIAILLPIPQDAPSPSVQGTLNSICAQIYPHWELVIVAAKSVDPSVLALVERYAQEHERIDLKLLDEECGQAEKLNAGLNLVRSEFTAVVETGDQIAEQALFQIASEIYHHPHADWLYSDEDRLDVAGQRIQPFFKPGWSPELALSSYYTGQLSVFRTASLGELGGWRGDYEGAHHYELALRMMARGVHVHHVADVLYHSRRQGGHAIMAGTTRPAALPLAQTAARDYCRQMGWDVAIEPTQVQGCFRVRRAIRGNPLVSIVIPTASKQKLDADQQEWYLLNCIRSIRRESTYKNIEIVVVDNNDMPRELREAIEPYEVKRISYTRPFNLSAKMNLGVANSKGDYIIFLNDDIEVITPDWIEGMLEYAQDEQVGAVGVKLLFPNGQLQHAGVVWTHFGPAHLFYNEKQSAADRYAPAHLTREMLAVTGACVMVKKADCEMIGGWSESLPLNYNDIDFCLKLVAAGRRCIYTPYVELRHFESVSQTTDDRVTANLLRECKLFMDIWRDKHARDPYYNPNFLIERAFYRINAN